MTQSRTGGSLPAETTSFVGRASEIADTKELLGTSRLVTLIGPGGVGKTRLAVKVAGELPRARFDDVRMVELSGLQNPILLPHTIAAAFGLPEQSASPPIELLTDYLADRNLLLILDTCEHLLDACATVTDVLLRGAPRLHVLATSRQALDVPGEHTVHVAPFDMDPAVRLFVERAAAVVPRFALSDANRETVTALCRRLDGIPLAIELATVRLRAMPLSQLAARLEDRFRLLTAGRRTALERHQTLRSAISWSYELCGQEERTLWARLSVFADGFDVEAAERVCADEHLLPDAEIMDHLLGLVDKSIVLWTETPYGTRYRLLDTLREFGRERLAENDEETQYLDRHLACFREQADAFNERFLSDEQEERYWRLDADLANLRAALGRCFASKDNVTEGLELAVRLWPFWVCGAHYTEGRYWMDKGLERVTWACELRATALRLSAWYGAMQGDHDWPLDRMAESLRIAEELGSQALIAYANQYFGVIRMFRDEPEAEDLFTAAREKFAELDDDFARALLHYQNAFLYAMRGDVERGLAMADVTLALTDGREERWAQTKAHYVKSVCYWRGGDRRQAAEEASEALLMTFALRDVLGIAQTLEVLAWVAASERRAVRAAWMLGAVSGLWRTIGTPLFGMAPLLGFHADAERAAIEVLGEDGYDVAFSAGVAMRMEDAVQSALDDLDDLGDGAAAVKPAKTGLGLLTARETQVAVLVSEGLSNREIAERLVVSKRTTDSHIEHILTKLGFSSRAQISALVARESTGPRPS